jgi:uncharacterized membrane protein
MVLHRFPTHWQDLPMFGISNFGMLHTVIGLLAVVTGYVMLIRHGAIGSRSRLGLFYSVTTVITCFTGFFIFRHGSFGVAHVLGVITLVTLALAAWAGRTTMLGRAGRYVETLSYTATLFFHMIPGFVETTTRIPAEQPFASGPDDPALQAILGGVLLVFLGIGAAQVWHLRRGEPAMARIMGSR